MTAAGVHQAASGAGSAPAARPGPAWLRLAWLYLVSRRAPTALVLLAGCGALLWAALHLHWTVAGGPGLGHQREQHLRGGPAGHVPVPVQRRPEQRAAAGQQR